MSSLIPPDMMQGKRHNLISGDGPMTPQKPPMIMHPDRLLNQAREFLEAEKINNADRQRSIKGKFRTNDKYERYPVVGLINHVDESIWANMLRAGTNGMLKTIANSQSNGQWQMQDAEAEFITDNKGGEHIVLGIRWVDMRNEKDLGYTNGQPSVNVKIENQFPPELLEKLSASPDLELKELVKQLVLALTANATGKSVAPDRDE